MAHKKCIICNEPISDEQGVQYKQRFAHQKCFNIAMQTLQKDKAEKISKTQKRKPGKTAKPKAELKEALSEEEYNIKKNYYDYLRELIGGSEINSKIYAVSEDYIRRFGFTFLSMHQTLIYLHEIIEIVVNASAELICNLHIERDTFPGKSVGPRTEYVCISLS